MVDSLKGKVAIVTGAGRGIGRAIAIAFAREGAHVSVNYLRSEASALQVVEEIRRDGGSALACRADVSRRSEVDALVSEILSRFGRLDVLVNNAGVNRASTVLTTTDEALDEMLATNLRGVLNCVQAAAPAMMEQRSGKIINIGSIAALVTALAETSAYAISKASVVTLTKRLAFELGPYNVNVNAICPGVILTDMAKANLGEAAIRTMASRSVLGRVGAPEDMAEAARFLASDASRFITAQVLTVDGGRMDFLSRSG